MPRNTEKPPHGTASETPDTSSETREQARIAYGNIDQNGNEKIIPESRRPTYDGDFELASESNTTDLVEREIQSPGGRELVPTEKRAVATSTAREIPTEPTIIDGEFPEVQTLRPGLTQAQKAAREEKLLQNRAGEERHREREMRSEKFAEKFGLTAERQAMLAAEKEYFEAIKDHKARKLKLPFTENLATRKAKEQYERSIAAWRNGLASASRRPDAEKDDKISAKFIGVRDTALRMERTRQDAYREVIDSQGKLTKLMRRFTQGAGSAVSAGVRKYAEAADWVGGKMVDRLLEKASPEEQAVARRIAGSAAIMALVAAPLGAGGGAIAAGAIGFDFLSRVARGTISGAVLSATIANIRVAAEKNSAQIDAKSIKSRNELLKRLKGEGTQPLSIDQLREERELFAAGSIEGRREKLASNERMKTRAEIAAAVAVGGLAYGVAAGLDGSNDSPARNDGDTVSVNEATPAEQKAALKSAVEALAGDSVDTPSTPDQPAANSPSSSDRIEATIDNQGEGTDSIFLELKNKLEGTQNPSAVATLLLNAHQNEISRLMGERVYGEIGMRTQMGDSFYLDDKQNLMYKPVNGEAQLFIENTTTEPNGYKVHEIQGTPTTPQAPETPTTPVATPESPTAANAPEVPAVQPPVAEVPVTTPPPSTPAEQPAAVAPAVNDAPRTPSTLGDFMSPDTPVDQPAAPVPQVDNGMRAVEAPPPEPLPTTQPTPEAPPSTGQTLETFNPQVSQIARDPNGNAFVHVAAQSMGSFNKESLRLATEFATNNPNTPVYYIERSPSGFLGLGTKETVHAMVFDASRPQAGPTDYPVVAGAYTIPTPDTLTPLTKSV